MNIQNIQGSVQNNSSLFLTWQNVKEDFQAIAVEIALNSEFTIQAQMILLPKHVMSCSLALGSGNWFYRLGSLEGSDKQGKVVWTGIYNKQISTGAKLIPSPSKPPFTLLHSQSLDKGIKLFSSSKKTNYYILEYSHSDSFQATSRKTVFWKDWLSDGSMVCEPLDPSFTYSIRVACPSMNPQELPKSSVDVLSDWIIVKGKKALPISKPFTPIDITNSAAEQVLLQEAKERPLRFTSAADYTRYLAAKTKASSSIQRI